MVASLDVIFKPTSVAVIGASNRRGTIGAEVFHNLLTHGFNGPVYPVHPQAYVVQSVKAYSSITDITDPIDLAVIVVPAAAVIGVVRECAQKGVKGLVVISAGFREANEGGRQLEAELLEVTRGAGMRMIGPNCLGVQNTDPEVCLDATFAPTFPPRGNVSFLSQSGALGVAILDYARELGIGIADFASVGNKADVSGNDMIEYWEDDPQTDVILLYLESFGNPARFSPLARRVAQKKPMVVVKSGRTISGARAASSHTGSIAGQDVAVDALLKQAGVIRTDTIEQLFDMAMLLANQPLPKGNRVAVLTNAGGPGIMAADACESNGLELPMLCEETRAGLQSFLPEAASIRNPVDMIASANAEGYDRALRLLVDDPNIDAIIAIYVPPIGGETEAVAQALVSAAENACGKPILSCFMGTHGVMEALTSLKSGHIPSYKFPEAAAIALARAEEYSRWLQREDGTRVVFSDVDEPAARAALLGDAAPTVSLSGEERALSHARRRLQSGGVEEGPDTMDLRWLNPVEISAALGAYGLNMVSTRIADSAEKAGAVAVEMGFPCVLKLDSGTIAHKSDVGGVVMDLKSRREVEWAYRDLERKLHELGRADEMSGVILQPQVMEGLEAIVGVTHDPTFGPLIMFGIGGVQVELMRDVCFRLHAISDIDAHEMVRSIRGFPLFEGFRGGAPGDVPALEQLLLRVSQLISDFPEILEMDLNPVKVLRPGEGCVILDARIRVRQIPRRSG